MNTVVQMSKMKGLDMSSDSWGLEEEARWSMLWEVEFVRFMGQSSMWQL